MLLYIDDTTISTTIKTVIRTTTYLPISDILNAELSLENNWLKVNKLIINHNENQIYNFSYKKRKSSKV